jgi:hypothetical protein
MDAFMKDPYRFRNLILINDQCLFVACLWAEGKSVSGIPPPKEIDKIVDLSQDSALVRKRIRMSDLVSASPDVFALFVKPGG